MSKQRRSGNLDTIRRRTSIKLASNGITLTWQTHPVRCSRSRIPCTKCGETHSIHQGKTQNDTTLATVQVKSSTNTVGDKSSEQIYKHASVHHVNGQDITSRQVYGKTIGLSLGCIFTIWHIRTMYQAANKQHHAIKNRQLHYARTKRAQPDRHFLFL